MALNCALTSDYNFGCDVGAGGVKELWLIEAGNVVSMAESSGTITAITKVSGKIFRKYSLVVETSAFDETIEGNRQNGTLVYTVKGSIIINKQNVAVRNEMMLLARNNLIVIVHDQNDTYRLYGRQNFLRLASGSVATGTALTDRNGYTLEFTGKEPDPAVYVDPSVINTLQV